MSNKAIYFNVDSDDFASALCENPIFVEKVASIFTRVLDERIFHSKSEDDECDIQEAARITGRSVATLYSDVHTRKVPHEKRGRLLRFSRKKLREWKSIVKTAEEIDIESSNRIVNRKK